MTGNFFAALKQIKDGGDRIDKGVPYLFLYAPLEVSDVIFTRSINKGHQSLMCTHLVATLNGN